MGSLQDALLKSGLVDEEKSRQARKPSNRDGQPSGKKKTRSGAADASRQPRRKSTGKKGPRKTGRTPGKAGGDSDLAAAYAARKRQELAEKEKAKQARVADQEERRKRNLELDRLVEGKVLNKEEAELPRYFEHIGKIRRVMVTPEQRAAINAGSLGVVNLRGRYLVVDPETLAAYQEKAPDLVPDLGGKEPDAPEGDDYPPVPDDIDW